MSRLDYLSKRVAEHIAENEEAKDMYEDVGYYAVKFSNSNGINFKWENKECKGLLVVVIAEPKDDLTKEEKEELKLIMTKLLKENKAIEISTNKYASINRSEYKDQFLSLSSLFDDLKDNCKNYLKRLEAIDFFLNDNIITL